MKAEIEINGETFFYDAVPPKTDTAEANEGQRLIFRHASWRTKDNPPLIVAPAEVIHAGWVLGINMMKA